jgi:hypothetical protein
MHNLETLASPQVTALKIKVDHAVTGAAQTGVQAKGGSGRPKSCMIDF